MAEKLSADNLKLPEHVAIIMDGNRRWADKRGILRIQGHEAGLQNMHNVAGYLNDYKIKYVSVFAFSTENWNRPRDEVEALLGLLERRIDEVARSFNKHNIKLRHVGGLERLSSKVVGSIHKAIELTKNNTGITLNLAFNYGGRAEIINATKRIISDGIPADRVDETLFSRYLYTAGIPDVDLLIRTGGELRISNFLIWQSAYAEYYFSELLWPDFDKAELERALLAYSQRQRRFGKL